MIEARAAVGFAIACALATAIGCGEASSPDGARVPDSQADIARIHRAKCGKCHQRVEPGERTRRELEVALAHHHDRVPMTDDQWRAMVDYLAQPAPTR